MHNGKWRVSVGEAASACFYTALSHNSVLHSQEVTELLILVILVILIIRDCSYALRRYSNSPPFEQPRHPETFVHRKLSLFARLPSVDYEKGLMLKQKLRTFKRFCTSWTDVGRLLGLGRWGKNGNKWRHGHCLHVVVFKSRILQDKNLEHFEREDGQTKFGLCLFCF